MSNIIRNILFVLAIVALIVYSLPGRPPLEDLLENIVPFLIPFLVVIIFIFKAKSEIKKKGFQNKTELVKKLMSSEFTKSLDSKKNKSKSTNILDEIEKFINRSK
ncbi:MAG: hypothetical protein CMI53_02985 [Parcubacteria group bacterium]|nr:hypothetical protein [Parcubacteria group bacterium]|tara:strand:- start:7608 stop:7922 length:315 start_codon:yes stop_codon:yes gene_type:complete